MSVQQREHLRTYGPDEDFVCDQLGPCRAAPVVALEGTQDLHPWPRFYCGECAPAALAEVLAGEWRYDFEAGGVT